MKAYDEKQFIEYLVDQYELKKIYNEQTDEIREHTRYVFEKQLEVLKMIYDNKK